MVAAVVGLGIVVAGLIAIQSKGSDSKLPGSRPRETQGARSCRVWACALWIASFANQNKGSDS